MQRDTQLEAMDDRKGLRESKVSVQSARLMMMMMMMISQQCLFSSCTHFFSFVSLVWFGGRKYFASRTQMLFRFNPLPYLLRFLLKTQKFLQESLSQPILSSPCLIFFFFFDFFIIILYFLFIYYFFLVLFINLFFICLFIHLRRSQLQNSRFVPSFPLHWISLLYTFFSLLDSRLLSFNCLNMHILTHSLIHSLTHSLSLSLSIYIYIYIYLNSIYIYIYYSNAKCKNYSLVVFEFKS